MLIIPAYAKLNLCLAVRGRRSDGFHEIDSVAAAIDWHDLVGITVTGATGGTTVRLRATGAAATQLGDEADNLAVRAAEAFAARAGPLSVDIWLQKSIPAESGLGGGSADAAAVLRGLNGLLASQRGAGGPAPLDAATLHELAAGLGSDVPLLLAGGVQRMRGRGDQLAALPAAALCVAVVVGAASGTAATYAAVQEHDFDDGPCVDRVAEALAAGATPDPGDLGSSLEAPACRAHPDLDERLTALRAAVPEVRWHLTGSGGAAFAIADSPGHAEELAGCARAFSYLARACRTVPAS